MRKKLLFLLCIIIIPCYSRVLFLVNPEIHNDQECLQAINNYSADLLTYYGVASEVVENTFSGTGNTQDQCRPVRQFIGDRYQSFMNTTDPLTGVVLIGDVPPPMFMRRIVIPSDYYYMDCYDRVNSRLYWINQNVWNFAPSPGDELFHLYDGSVGIGDNTFDIWVSRVTPSYLQRVSDDNTWTGSTPDFLTPREIVRNYVARARAWMTERAQVPPRGFGMGDIYGYNLDRAWALDNIQNSVGFEFLDLDFRNYFVRPHENKPDFLTESYLYNNGANWQSQLQAGPFGNITCGAFRGVINSSLNAVDNRNSRFLPSDVTGYLFAFIEEHGHREGHTFGVVSWGDHSRERHGNFDSFNNLPLWDRVYSPLAHGGSYYECRDRNRIFTGAMNEHEYIITYTQEIPSLEIGTYTIEMWIPDVSDRHEHPYINIWFNQHYLWNGPFDQRGVPGWRHILDQTGSPLQIVINQSDFGAPCPNLIHIEMTAHNMPPGMPNDRTVADALRLTNTTGTEFTIDNDNLLPTQEFYWENMKDRQLYDMKFDGGRSKTKFFFHNVCEENLFTIRDKTGNAYALTDSGLISVGTSEDNWHANPYDIIFQGLNGGLSFGESFLNYVNIRGMNRHYQLLGFGTVYKKAFKPYVEFEDATLNLSLSNQYKDLYVQNDLELNNGVISNNSVLNAKAGKSIVINPGYVLEHGSEVKLAIDPDLL